MKASTILYWFYLPSTPQKAGEIIDEAYEEGQQEIKELKEELSVLTSRFNDVADEPAAKKVRNTFSQDAETQKSLTERRLESLISIRKGK